MAEITITKSNFENEVLNSGIPVLVDLWAAWCGPCRMQAPIIYEIAKEFSEKLSVIKVNVDDNENLALKYGISAIPTIIVFKNGKTVEKAVGLSAKAELIEMLKKHL